MNITFFLNRKWSTEYCSEVFSSKKPIRLNESQKFGFGDTFSLISVVLLGRLFPKAIGLTYEWTHTYHVIFMKIISKLQRVLCVLIHIFVIRDLQNEECDHPHFLHSHLSEVEDARIVIISFQNMAKKKNSFYTIYSDIIMEYSGSEMILKTSILYR